jgi:hypothetical protein
MKISCRFANAELATVEARGLRAIPSSKDLVGGDMVDTRSPLRTFFSNAKVSQDHGDLDTIDDELDGMRVRWVSEETEGFQVQNAMRSYSVIYAQPCRASEQRQGRASGSYFRQNQVNRSSYPSSFQSRYLSPDLYLNALS